MANSGSTAPTDGYNPAGTPFVEPGEHGDSGLDGRETVGHVATKEVMPGFRRPQDSNDISCGATPLSLECRSAHLQLAHLPLRGDAESPDRLGSMADSNLLSRRGDRDGDPVPERG